MAGEEDNTESHEASETEDSSSSSDTETVQRSCESKRISHGGSSASQEESPSDAEERAGIKTTASTTRISEGSSENETTVHTNLGDGTQGNVPLFVTARSLVAEDLLRQDVFLSPGFRSAAAMAGWDDEALLMATEEGDPCLNLVMEEDKRASLEATSPGFLEKSPQMNFIREMREKKREERTPQLAATPLSAGRRHRRARRQTIHGCSPEALPIGDLSLKEEFQNGVSQINSKENAAPKCSEDQRQQDTGSSSSGNVATQSEATNQKPGCLEQLREELSCAICLDICFEPSTTSCGHSFCRGCMQSVLQKCGLRCPKCRQTLKGDTWRSCPVNIVLWNTVQLLFPDEVAARKEVAKATETVEVVLKHEGITRNASQGLMEPGPRTSTWQHARPPSAGLRRRGSGRRVVMTNNRRVEEGSALARDGEGEPNTGDSEATRRRQMLADAAFARQLQMQLMSRNVGSNNTHRSGSASPDLASAAANLRAMANRAVRNRSRY